MFNVNLIAVIWNSILNYLRGAVIKYFPYKDCTIMLIPLTKHTQFVFILFNFFGGLSIQIQILTSS